jgi:phosphoribosylanthranilate isomerase
MDFQVKICGVRDHDGAQACVEAGADLVGFNFVPSSKRFITPSEARRLVQVVGAKRAVGVFRNQDEAHVLQVSRAAGVGWIQLHGDESPEVCASLRAHGFRIIKAISMDADTANPRGSPPVPGGLDQPVPANPRGSPPVPGGLDQPVPANPRGSPPVPGGLDQRIFEVARYEAVTDLRLFDASSPGSGQQFDHGRLLALSPARPFLLAGGLTPENVGAAVEGVNPNGVDTASGVEREGRMDPARVAAFCRAARTARKR